MAQLTVVSRTLSEALSKSGREEVLQRVYSLPVIESDDEQGFLTYCHALIAEAQRLHKEGRIAGHVGDTPVDVQVSYNFPGAANGRLSWTAIAEALETGLKSVAGAEVAEAVKAKYGLPPGKRGRKTTFEAGKVG